jgi:hypothetical protein
MKLPKWVFSSFPSWPSLLRWFVHVHAPDSRTQPLTDSRIGCSPKFGPSTVQDSGLPHVRDFTSSPNQDSRTLHIREFEASQVPGFRKSWVPCSWKTCFENFAKLNVSRVTGFPEFPNKQQNLWKLSRTQRWPEYRIKSLLFETIGNYGVALQS